MSNAYSLDLRERVIVYVQEGGEKTQACQIFKIGRDTLYRWLRQHQTKGTLTPKVRGKYTPRKLDDDAVTTYIAAHPDATLAELGTAFGVSAVAMWKACQRLQITRKKNASVRRAKRARPRPLSKGAR